ncbi:hypothetical protein [Mesorhizobium sp.]|uniref:hypothetical protein n=1 Tax=Mesorhizobium sp. TaxID=1871066 RepID=UPI000FE944FD|nr:hypothetical protein [Mesorhizobium sp.]RWA59467.1 MAG: hypothetical protein EOQ27_26475 [Mesorhizobium sp.]
MLIAAFWDDIKAGGAEAWQFVKHGAANAWQSIVDGATGLWENIVSAFQEGQQEAVDASMVLWMPLSGHGTA